MKKLLIVMMAIMCYQFSNAQKIVKRDTIYTEESRSLRSRLPKSDVETLFPNQKSFGGYYGVSMGYSLIDNEDAVVLGSRLMMVTNHYLGIGFGGKAFFSSSDSISYDSNTDDVYISIGGGYGGLYLEPVLFSLKPVHVSFPILIGAGGIVKDQWTNNMDNRNNIGSVYFIIEPGIDLELNITQWFRIGLGASYRLTSTIDGLGDDTPNDVLNGFTYGMTFKVGWF